LAAAVDLPVLGGRDRQAAFKPVVLGKVEGGGNSALGVKLVGGETALRGDFRFEIQPAAAGEPPGWYISKVSKDDPGRVAHVWRDGSDLKFQWLGDAADLDSNYLRNCGLVFSGGGQDRWLPLSKPVKTDPLVIHLDRRMSDLRLPPHEYLPPAAQLHLKVMVLDKAFPRHVTKVEDARSHVPKSKDNHVAAGGGETDTLVGRGAIDLVVPRDAKTPAVMLRIRFEPKSGTVFLHTDALYDAGSPRWPTFTMAIPDQLDGTAQLRESQGKAMSARGPAMTAAVKALQQQASALHQQAAGLRARATALAEKKIDYQVFVPLSPQYKLVLFQSTDEPSTAPKSAGKQ
jgi:hypothetical protein